MRTKIDELLNSNARLRQIIEQFRDPSEVQSREFAKVLVDPLQDLIRQQKMIEVEMRNVYSAVQPPMTLDPGLVRTDSKMLVRFPLPKDDIHHLREEVAALTARIEQTRQPEQPEQKETTTDPCPGSRPPSTGQYL